MIDAYAIGITLALDNGVSAGLATIRRDLIVLNGIVEGSTTRLKNLTRAGADLQSLSAVGQQTGESPAPRAHRRVDGIMPPAIDWTQPDSGSFHPAPPGVPQPTQTGGPRFSVTVAQPQGQTEKATASHFRSKEADMCAPSSDFAAYSEGMRKPWTKWGPKSVRTPDDYPTQVSNLAPAFATPWIGPLKRNPMEPLAKPSGLTGNNPRFSQSRPNQPHLSVLVDRDQSGRRPLRLPDPSLKNDLPQSGWDAEPDTTAWAQPPVGRPVLSSAVPPPNENSGARVARRYLCQRFPVGTVDDRPSC